MKYSVLKRRKIEKDTARLYSYIFSQINDEEFMQKSKNYIRRIKIDKVWLREKVCLDAGCGSGIATYALATIDKTKVYAFDIADTCLAITQKRLKGRTNVYPVRASIETIPFKNVSFDFINCNGVLHHLINVDDALAELFRVLKLGGMIFIGVYGSGGLLNEFKIKSYRLLAKAIPYLFLCRVLCGKNRNELLDNICVPIRRAFKEEEMRQKLLDLGFSGVRRIAEDFYRRPANLWEKIIIGQNGLYMHFLAEK